MVLREACRQTASWQQQFPAEEPFTISVNLSAKQLKQPDLLEQDGPDHRLALLASALDEAVRVLAQRASWGLFRDRRPDLYQPLLTLDGETRRT